MSANIIIFIKNEKEFENNNNVHIEETSEVKQTN